MFFCLLNSFDFVSFVCCLAFFNSKITGNITHGGFFFLVISHLWYFLRDFWPYFFLNENVHVICCWKLGEFKRGDSLINEGILPKARKRKPRRWPGNPLKYKVQSKGQQWVIRVFEIHRINYCFLVLSKTGIFFLQPWRSRRSNIVWRGHILLSFSNGKPQSGHTFGRPTNSQLENMFKFPYLALTRLNSALSRTNSPNLATAKWTPILISHPTLRVISQLLHKGQHHTVKPRFKDNFFSQNLHKESVSASNRRERFCSCSPAWPRWSQSKTSNYIKLEFKIKQWVISSI